MTSQPTYIQRFVNFYSLDLMDTAAMKLLAQCGFYDEAHVDNNLEDPLDLGLVRGAYGAAVPAVADVLPALHLCRGNALGAAGHLLECDRRNVLHIFYFANIRK